MAKTARTPRRKTVVDTVEIAEVEHNEIETVDPENAKIEKPDEKDGSDEEGQYEIEKVISHHPKSATDASGVKKYTVKWLGYSESDNSIEPKANLAGCKKLIETYWETKQEEKEEEAEVEAVLEHHPKTAIDDSGTEQYTVKWLGCCEEENTIEPKDNLADCKLLIETYWKVKQEELMSAKKKKTSSRRGSKKSLGNKSADKKFVGKEQESSSRMQISDVLAAALKKDAVEKESDTMEVDSAVVPAPVVPLESYNSHMGEPDKMEIADNKTNFQELTTLELCNMTHESISHEPITQETSTRTDCKAASKLNFSGSLDELLDSEDIEETIKNKDKLTNNDIVADSAVILNQLEPTKSCENESEHKMTSSAMKKLSIKATVTKIKPVIKNLSAPKKRAKMSMPFLLEEMNKGYAEENEFLRNLAEHQDMPTHLSEEINKFLSRYNEEF